MVFNDLHGWMNEWMERDSQRDAHREINLKMFCHKYLTDDPHSSYFYICTFFRLTYTAFGSRENYNCNTWKSRENGGKYIMIPTLGFFTKIQTFANVTNVIVNIFGCYTVVLIVKPLRSLRFF